MAMIFIETPANPTNDLVDIAMCRALADQYGAADRRVMIAVDNTYTGSPRQHPLRHGAGPIAQLCITPTLNFSTGAWLAAAMPWLIHKRVSRGSIMASTHSRAAA